MRKLIILLVGLLFDISALAQGTGSSGGAGGTGDPVSNCGPTIALCNVIGRVQLVDGLLLTPVSLTAVGTFPLGGDSKIETVGYNWIVVQFTAVGEIPGSPPTPAPYSTLFESSLDGINWYGACLRNAENNFTVTASTTNYCWGNPSNTQAAVGAYEGPITGRYFRVRAGGAGGSGTTTVSAFLRSSGPPLLPGNAVQGMTLEGSTPAATLAPVEIGVTARTGDTTPAASGAVRKMISTREGAVITRPWAIPEVGWSYAAAAAGILNTNTAVIMAAAASGSGRRYVTGCHIMSEALGTATELAIRDGAGGTVLWRMKIGTAGLVAGTNVTFATPLRGTAATLLEVVTLTASGTGAVYVNCQGYTGV